MSDLLALSQASQLHAARVSKLPFHWNSRDGLVSLGAAPIFTRNSRSMLVPDSLGNLRRTTDHIPIYDHFDYNADGILERRVLRKAVAATNLVTSQNISTWTDEGTPNIAAIPGPFDGVSGYSVEDNSASVLEGKFHQINAFTGSVVKPFTVYIKKLTSATSYVELKDQTGGVNRVASLVTWIGDDPGTPSSITGLFLYKRRLRDGWWELNYRSTTITEGNTHRVYVYGSGNVGSNTGITGWALPTVTDAMNFGGLVASQITVGDDLRIAFPFLTQSISLYSRFFELGAIYTTVGACVAAIGLTSNATTAPRIAQRVGASAGVYNSIWDPAGTPTTATQGAGSILGQLVELLTTVSPLGALNFVQRLNGGAQTAVAGGTIALPSSPTYFGNSQANSVVVIGDIGPATSEPASLGAEAVKAQFGVQTMDYMAAAY